MKCPCCGQPVDEVPIAALSAANLTAMERAVVDYLVSVYPRKATVWHISEAIYSADPSGGPLDAAGVVGVYIHSLRKKLPDLGWTIPKVWGTAVAGRLYGLEKIDADKN